jgi:hypothetical protein
MTESDSDITFDDEDSSLFEDSDYVGGSESEGGVGFLLRRKEGSTQVPPSPNDMQSSACESSPALTSAYSSSPGYMHDRRGYNNEYFDGKQVSQDFFRSSLCCTSSFIQSTFYNSYILMFSLFVFMPH